MFSALFIDFPRPRTVIASACPRIRQQQNKAWRKRDSREALLCIQSAQKAPFYVASSMLIPVLKDAECALIF